MAFRLPSPLPVGALRQPRIARMHIDASVLALTLQPSLNDFSTTALMHTPVAAPLARSYCRAVA